MSKVSRSAIYYIVSNYISVFIGFATSIVAVRFVDIDTFGVLSHVRNVSVFLVPFVWLGTNSILIRIMTYRTKYILFGWLFFGYVVVALLFSLLTAFVPTLYFGTAIYHQYALSLPILLSLSFVALIQNFFDTAFLAAERAKLVSGLTVIYSLASLVAVLALVTRRDLNLALLIQAALTALVLLVLAIFHAKDIASNTKTFLRDMRNPQLRAQAKQDWKKEFKFFRFYTLSNISNVIMKRIVSIYFANNGQTSYLGILAIYNQFVDILLNLGWSVNNSWGINRLKMLVERCKKKLADYPHLIEDYLKEASVINYLLITVFLLSSPIWIGLLGFLLARWHISYPLFSIILFFIVLRYAIDFLTRILLYNPLYISEKLGVQMLVCTGLDLALTPVNYWLVAHFSLYGALFTTLLPGLVTYLSSELFVKEHRLLRTRLVLISIVSFAPIALMHFPSSFWLSAVLTACISIIISLIFYLLYGRRYKQEIQIIVSSIGFLSRPIERILKIKGIFVGRNQTS